MQHYLDRKVVSSQYSASIGTRQTNTRLLPPLPSSSRQSASTLALSKPANADTEQHPPDFFTDCLRNEHSDLRTRVAHSLLGALQPRARPSARARVAGAIGDSTPIAGERATRLVAQRSSNDSGAADARPSAALRDKYAAFVPPAGAELPAPADEEPKRSSDRPSGHTSPVPTPPESECVREASKHTPSPTLVDSPPLIDQYVLERDVILKVPKYRQSRRWKNSLATHRSYRRDATSLGVGADSWFAGMGFRPSEH